MIKILKALFLQKNQLIKDIRKAPMRKFFKGVPTIDCNRSDCRICEQVCPTGAIKNGRIDLGKCNFCGECERVCPNSLIKFSNYNRLGATKREDLIVSTELSPIEVIYTPCSLIKSGVPCSVKPTLLPNSNSSTTCSELFSSEYSLK